MADEFICRAAVETQNRLMDMGGGEERVSCTERGTGKLPSAYVKYRANGNCCMAQETQTGALYQPRGVGWGGRFKSEFQKGGSICIPLADSCWGLTENNKIL